MSDTLAAILFVFISGLAGFVLCYRLRYPTRSRFASEMEDFCLFVTVVCSFLLTAGGGAGLLRSSRMGRIRRSKNET